MEEGFSLTKTFMSVVKWGALLFIGALLTEPLIFAMFHGNLGGMNLMATLSPHFNAFFDATGITNLLHGLSTFFGGGTEQLAGQLGSSVMSLPDGGTGLVPDFSSMSGADLVVPPAAPPVTTPPLKETSSLFGNFGNFFSPEPAMAMG